MAGSPERQQKGAIDRGLDVWQNINKVTLAGELGVALFVPALAVPALTLAAIDGVQMIAIMQVQESRNIKSSAPRTVYSAANDDFVYKKAA